ncbi:hypothetical protein EYF80_061055 [Liparis tanakae]|uniref:Uncharacterized protein n=1 Tax=Liparis tanakae TaxID=230148 RepID=A0A4Z2EJ58_9TELE|nr:hypothetical protein EYF80_061055 [Liparis tanakae]
MDLNMDNIVSPGGNALKGKVWWRRSSVDFRFKQKRRVVKDPDEDSRYLRLTVRVVEDKVWEPSSSSKCNGRLRPETLQTGT